MSVNRPMGHLVSLGSHNLESLAMQSSGSKEPPYHLGLMQASDPMQELQHPGRCGKTRILQVCCWRAESWSSGRVCMLHARLMLYTVAIETSDRLCARVHGLGTQLSSFRRSLFRELLEFPGLRELFRSVLSGKAKTALYALKLLGSEPTTKDTRLTSKELWEEGDSCFSPRR
jgi:hypothetical protein